MNLLVIIPAYNEDKSIVSTIEDLKKDNNYDFLIIDDGSTDNTKQVCIDHGYPLISFNENKGLGYVFREAILYALDHGYDAIAQFDADGQHRRVDLITIAREFKKTNPDFYIGARNPKGIKRFTPRMLGSKIIKICIYLKTGKKLKDPTSGLRIFGHRAMKRYLKGDFKRPEPDMLTRLILEGYTFNQSPIIVKKRLYGESFLKGFNGFKFLVDICISILKMPKELDKKKVNKYGESKS